MVMKVYEEYSPYANTPNSNYPLGSIRNETVPDANDGTPIEQAWANDIEGFKQASLLEAGIIANGTPDTALSSQWLIALKIICSELAFNLIKDNVYPVGSIFTSISNGSNPNSILGFGTWVAITGRFLAGFDSGDSSFNVLGGTGGNKTHDHGGSSSSHTLTIDEMPSHTHGGVPLQISPQSDRGTNTSLYSLDDTGNTSPSGGGLGHSHSISSSSNLPPYVTVYMWRRTA